MIDLNIAPKNLRRKKKKSLLPGGFQIPKEVVVGSAGGVLVLLVVVHVLLQILIFQKIFQHKHFKSELEKLSPEKSKAEAIITELRTLQAKIKSIEKITDGKGMLWSKKLNTVSDVLPRGVWIRKMALSDEVLFIDGSAISQKNNEMINIHDFANGLKKQSDFMGEFNDLELGSIQSRKIQQTDVADFLIKIKLK